MLKKQISLKDPLTKLLLIAGAIAFAAYLFAQKSIIKPHRGKIANLSARLEHIGLEDEIAKILHEIDSCEKYLPPQKDPSWLLTQITELASQAKLDIESVEPLPTKDIPPYSYVPFKINTTCTFNKLVNFIKSIESSPFILSVESVNLKSAGVYKQEVPKEELGKETHAGVEIVVGTIY